MTGVARLMPAGEEGVLLKILGIEQVKAAADTGPKLTCDQQVEAVRRLAHYKSPAAIAKAMKDECGIEISPQAIAYYDPTRFALKRCPKRWSVLFWKLRARGHRGQTRCRRRPPHRAPAVARSDDASANGKRQYRGGASPDAAGRRRNQPDGRAKG